MPRVNTQVARKDYPEAGIKKGDKYYKWAFKFGPKMKSLKYPTRSQLTRSEFYSTLYDIDDRFQALTPDDSLQGELESIAEELRALGEECSDKLSNMPDSLQYAPSGELLQERADECEDRASQIEDVASNIDIDNKDEDQTDEEYYQEQLDEALGIDLDIS